jgi:hypothetical protein
MSGIKQHEGHGFAEMMGQEVLGGGTSVSATPVAA